MRRVFLSFSITVVAMGFLPALPPYGWLLLLLVPACALLVPSFRFRLSHSLSAPVVPIVAGCLLGALWSLVWAHWTLAHRMPESHSGESFVVSGQVVGLPDSDSRRQRFLLDVAQRPTESGVSLPVRRIQVSWYGGPAVNSGESWQLKLRLRPPRGFVNPSAFDYQLWLMRQGVDAVGYVRAHEGNRRLAPASKLSLGYWRQRARTWLETHPGWPEGEGLAQGAMLQALLIGERSGLTNEQWQRLQRTGTNHLIAISGLHIGFVALCGFTLGSLLGRPLNLLFYRVPSAWVGHALALVLALVYSALAGFSLPTQRALVMVAAVQLALLGRRHLRPSDLLILALATVLLLDPLAGFDLGFWLSFAAVAVLLLAFVGRTPSRQPRPGASLIRSQWVVFLGLLMPLVLLTQGATLLAPLANVLAIPLVTFAVVPWLLFAASLAGVWPSLSGLFLRLADWGLTGLELWLVTLDELAGEALQFQPHLGWPGLVLASLAVLMLLLPSGLPGRRLGYPALVLALWLPGERPPPLRLTFLDVGQGLAVVVQTPRHSLVYDTGPRYSDRMDAGGAIVAPYLRRRGVSELDAVVVSHGDIDHAGGLKGLLTSIPATRLWLGEPSRLDSGASLPESLAALEARDCHENRRWQWDGVRFSLLFAGQPAEANSNNHSCVLLIEYADQRLLLAGDIEREVEWRLIGRERVPEALTLLQVPHHGSASSSTPVWVERVRPEWAVVSAGYENHLGHPHPDVEARYREQGSELLHTGELGALEFWWDDDGTMSRRYYRKYQKRYWY